MVQAFQAACGSSSVTLYTLGLNKQRVFKEIMNHVELNRGALLVSLDTYFLLIILEKSIACRKTKIVSLL